MAVAAPLGRDSAASSRASPVRTRPISTAGPAVWKHPAGACYVYVTDNSGTDAYWVPPPIACAVAWQSSQAGTSPSIAGGLLYVYNLEQGVLDVFNPQSGHLYRSLPAASGHWNSPIVVGGRIILPVGDDNDHLTRGELFIYHLPGV